MALQINKQVTLPASGLPVSSCYVMVLPRITYSGDTFPCDSGIWLNKENHDQYPEQGTIPGVIEVPTAFNAPIELAIQADAAHNFLYNVCAERKAQLLVLNPSWTTDDILIVDL